MTESKRKKQTKVQREEFNKPEERGTLLSLSGTALDIVGKIMLCAGVTALLMFLFTFLESLIGFGTIAAAAIVVGGGSVAMILGNRLKTGAYFEGLLTA